MVSGRSASFLGAVLTAPAVLETVGALTAVDAGIALDAVCTGAGTVFGTIADALARRAAHCLLPPKAA